MARNINQQISIANHLVDGSITIDSNEEFKSALRKDGCAGYTIHEFETQTEWFAGCVCRYSAWGRLKARPKRLSHCRDWLDDGGG